MSPTRIYLIHQKKLRKRIKLLEAKYAKKMRIVQQKVRRYKARVITLRSILDTLKNNKLLNETQADMIHMLGKSVRFLSD